MAHEDWQLIWSEDENEETLADAVRRITGLSLLAFKQSGTVVQNTKELRVYLCGEFKLKDYSGVASEIYKKVVR